MHRYLTFCLIFIFILMGISILHAQKSQEDLSRQAANPLADLMSFPFQNNLNINYGEFDRNLNVLNIQPVLPFADGRIITRTIFPVLWIPDYSQESGMYSSGLGDISLTAIYAPASEGLTWGVGPVLEIPAGGEKRGTQKWGLGPSAVVLVQPGDLTLGALLNNVWSVAGDDSRAEVNKMLLNLFVVYQLGEGWYVNSAPIITADWKAESGEQWTVPLGAGFGKVTFVGGKLPLNVQTQLYYNVVHPDFGPEWQWRFQMQVLLPKSILF